MYKILSTVLFLFATYAIGTDFNIQCNKFASPLSGGYCIHVPMTERSGDILYYFHGAGLNEFTWQEEWYYTAQIRKEWKSSGTTLPTVVSLSFGPKWVLIEKNSSPSSGLFEVFTKKIIPEIEGQLGTIGGRRMAFGESMGGFNSVQLALKTKLFHKAAILCSPMAAVSCFSSASEIEKYMKNSTAWQYHKYAKENPIPESVAELFNAQKLMFPTEADWVKADPLALARNSAKVSTALYVAAGFYDPFVLYEGNEQFAEILKAKGADIDWRPQWGGHCAIDIPSLASFLTK
jgi:S-formylglutathione hydrolase FrmB